MPEDPRPATEADLAAVTRLIAAAFSPYIPRIGKPPGPMRADHGAAIAAGEVWVVANGTDLTGLIRLIAQPDHLLIDTIAVAPEAQGRGLGRALLAFARRHAAEHGLREIRLSTNVAMTENLQLYPKMGFTETHRATQDGYDRVFFRLPLG